MSASKKKIFGSLMVSILFRLWINSLILISFHKICRFTKFPLIEIITKYLPKKDNSYKNNKREIIFLHSVLIDWFIDWLIDWQIGNWHTRSCSLLKGKQLSFPYFSKKNNHNCNTYSTCIITILTKWFWYWILM